MHASERVGVAIAQATHLVYHAEELDLQQLASHKRIRRGDACPTDERSMLTSSRFQLHLQRPGCQTRWPVAGLAAARLHGPPPPLSHSMPPSAQDGTTAKRMQGQSPYRRDKHGQRDVTIPDNSIGQDGQFRKASIVCTCSLQRRVGSCR